MFWALLKQEKEYNRVDRDALWQVMHLYGVSGELLKAVRIFFVDSRACSRIGNKVSDWFSIKVDVYQGCVMLLWLLN